MKKISILLILTLSVLLALTACEGGNDAQSDAAQSDAGENGTVEEEKTVDVEITESGYSVGDDGYLNYGVVFHNPSENDAYEFHKVIITAYDENGDVLANEEQVMNRIQPGETQAFSSIVDCNGQTPDKVEFTPESGDKISPSDDAIKSSDLEISGTNERAGEWETSITGKIKNNSSSDTDSIGVVVLFKKEGSIVGGNVTYVDNLSAGQEKAFEISGFEVPEHDSYEVTAIDWGF